MKTKKIGIAGRLGARYGLKVRKRYADVMSASKKKQKCPYCARLTVKRVSVGIYHCSKCNSEFTGRAYLPK